MFLSKSDTTKLTTINGVVVAKHGSHDQKTHGRKGGKGGGSGSSSNPSQGIGMGAYHEREELEGLGERAVSDTEGLANEAEDVELELLNSGMAVNSPDVRTARAVRTQLRGAKDTFERARKVKVLNRETADKKRKILREGYGKLERAFNASSGSDINSIDGVSEGIAMVMQDLETGLGLDSKY